MTPNEALRILGLEQDASQAQIRQAYRDLAKVWHPDRFENDPRLRARAEEAFKQLSAAYETLRNYRPPATAARPARKEWPPPPWPQTSSPQPEEPTTTRPSSSTEPQGADTTGSQPWWSRPLDLLIYAWVAVLFIGFTEMPGLTSRLDPLDSFAVSAGGLLVWTFVLILLMALGEPKPKGWTRTSYDSRPRDDPKDDASSGGDGAANASDRH